MKNKFHPAIIAILFSVLFTQISCSKDTIQPPGGAGDPSYQKNTVNGILPADQDNDSQGALYMEIAPLEAKAIVVVYNDFYNSGKIAANYTEGIVKLAPLAPGTYKIQITPINPVFQPLLIDDVEITADNVNNLGSILLGN